MKKLTAAGCLMALPLLAGSNTGDVPTTDKEPLSVYDSDKIN